MSFTRRSFITASALASGFLATKGAKAVEAFIPIQKQLHSAGSPVVVFSKNLQFLGIEEMARAAKAMGFDGVDLTVRPNGHVVPENVKTELPKAVEIIRSQGLDVCMITTAIANSSEKSTEDILKTAGGLGIKYYRMGWFDYIEKLSRRNSIVLFNKTFGQLQELNKKYGIHGAYQNHAGKHFGAAVLDLAMALEGIDPEWIGCQYDIRHATVEGANSWPIGYDLLEKHIKTINIKDFQWTKKEGNWKEENVPLGKGMVDFGSYLSRLHANNFKGPISMHFEYNLGGAENGATSISVAPETVFSSMQADLSILKQWLATYKR